MTTATTPARSIYDMQFPAVARLTPERERDLTARKAAGDVAAREALILHNVPLALSRAALWVTARTRSHRDTLVSSAILGLIDAVDGFTPGFAADGRAASFGTYATRAIDRKVRISAYREIPLVTLPHKYVEARGGPEAAADSPEDVALVRRALGCRAAGDAGSEYGAAVDRLAAGADDVGDGAAHASAPDLDRALAALAARSPAQARVIRLMFPMDGSAAMTLTEAGAVLGVRRQSVASVRAAGLRNLRKILGEMGVTA